MCTERCRLSSREREVVTYRAKGYKLKEIAAVLKISLGTAKTYLSRVFIKLAVCDSLQLILWVHSHDCHHCQRCVQSRFKASKGDRILHSLSPHGSLRVV
jgi:DNA-binding CsgD family transcriptional regulator